MVLSCCKKLSVLLREITSKHAGDHYCLSCLHFFRTENNSKNIKMCVEIMLIVA